MRGERVSQGQDPSLRSTALLSLNFPAEPAAIRDALACAMAALDRLELGGECLGDVELVLAEVLNNVHRHAYGEQPGQIGLELYRRLDEDVLVCTVTDSGCTMPGGRLPAGDAVAVDVRSEALPEGGFGWFLIRSHALALDYRREEDGNRLVVHLALRPAHGHHTPSVNGPHPT
ncbi:MAG: ATP-binding protein [Alkalilacustris sp.]